MKNLLVEDEKTIHRTGKTFINHISDNGLISRINKEFLQVNNKKINNPI